MYLKWRLYCLAFSFCDKNTPIKSQGRSSGRSLEAGAEGDPIEDCCVLPCSPWWLIHPFFLNPTLFHFEKTVSSYHFSIPLPHSNSSHAPFQFPPKFLASSFWLLLYIYMHKYVNIACWGHLSFESFGSVPFNLAIVTFPGNTEAVLTDWHLPSTLLSVPESFYFLFSSTSTKWNHQHFAAVKDLFLVQVFVCMFICAPCDVKVQKRALDHLEWHESSDIGIETQTQVLVKNSKCY